jgi:hypothetical protein
MFNVLGIVNNTFLKINLIHQQTYNSPKNTKNKTIQDLKTYKINFTESQTLSNRYTYS